MVDAIVSTGANIVDQDFFEQLGFKHYIADELLMKSGTEDGTLRELMIDRIYDTLIDEEELRICDDTTKIIADSTGTAAGTVRANSSSRDGRVSSRSRARRQPRQVSTASSGRPMNSTYRFSARLSVIALPALVW